MKVNLNYMSIFYRTPNCTRVNVVQSTPKFYRNTFSYMPNMNTSMQELPCKVTRKRPRKSFVFLTGQLIPTEETLKQPTSTSFLITIYFSFFSLIHSGDGFMEIVLCISYSHIVIAKWMCLQCQITERDIL